jgi:hypothetical protein
MSRVNVGCLNSESSQLVAVDTPRSELVLK